jgi:hypothetical protein
VKDPIRDATTAELREFASRLYTSHMERVLIEAAKKELKRREQKQSS